MNISSLNLDLFDDRIVIPSIKNSLLTPDINQLNVYLEAPEIDLSIYDYFIVCMSGGKDSIASLLRLFELGVPKNKIEMIHHLVDGDKDIFMDWPFITNYTTSLSKAFNIPIYFSWLKNGFRGEMLKNNSYAHNHIIETPDGTFELTRDIKRAKKSTRLKFPQQSPSLQTRWCSSALKIDIGRRWLNNQSRFNGKSICFITGERREESPNRAKYNQLEPHACDRRYGRMARRVDSWRNVLHFTEGEVWALLEKYKITPPIPYRLGWTRSSCQTCIYNSPRIWATIAEYFPERALEIARYERQFNVTISRKKIDVIQLAAEAKPFKITDLEALEQAYSSDYYLPIFTDNWKLPAGAFGTENCGEL